jgi:hypothetical protein
MPFEFIEMGVMVLVVSIDGLAVNVGAAELLMIGEAGIEASSTRGGCECVDGLTHAFSSVVEGSSCHSL